MFGYIKAYAPELRVREHEYYKAAYCGLCRALGKCCGCRSKCTLSYDVVFALLVRMAISGTKPEFERRRCGLHPFKKRPFMKMNPELEFCAKAGTLLAYGKLDDDVRDERGGKRIAARFARRAMKKANKKASECLPELKSELDRGLCALSELESKKEPTVDRPADLFGDIMAKIMAYGYGGFDEKIAAEIGRRAGRWVYITDAVDDCEKDKKKNSYNPFLLLYGDIPDDQQREHIKAALQFELQKLRDALDLVERGERRDLFEILENIIEFGMPASVELAMTEKEKDQRE